MSLCVYTVQYEGGRNVVIRVTTVQREMQRVLNNVVADSNSEEMLNTDV